MKLLHPVYICIESKSSTRDTSTRQLKHRLEHQYCPHYSVLFIFIMSCCFWVTGRFSGSKCLISIYWPWGGIWGTSNSKTIEMTIRVIWDAPIQVLGIGLILDMSTHAKIATDTTRSAPLYITMQFTSTQYRYRYIFKCTQLVLEKGDIGAALIKHTGSVLTWILQGIELPEYSGFQVAFHFIRSKSFNITSQKMNSCPCRFTFFFWWLISSILK